MEIRDHVLGILLGTAIGDALGLPFEGLPPARVARRIQRLGDLRHSLVLGRGMLSDDTEHACLTAHALAVSQRDTEGFRRALARSLRWWIVALPPAVGLATARGIVRLWLGWSPARSGVGSAGNGAMMRAAVIGAVAHDDAHLVELVQASTRLTHREARAEQAAVAMARLARTDRAPAAAIAAIEDPELRARAERALALALAREDLEAARTALAFHRGVTGFVNDTLPAVVFCWQRWPEDPRAAIEAAVRLGGDTDTVAALVGALAGASRGASALPAQWLGGVHDWPLDVATIHRLADALAQGQPPPPPPRPLLSLPRNLLLLAVVLGHALARALGR